jgi:alpha-tubulin suppressor-like RCC1 family protein
MNRVLFLLPLALLPLACSAPHGPESCPGPGPPSVVPPISTGKWRQVSAAEASTCALTNDGALWCWGQQLSTTSWSSGDDVAPGQVMPGTAWDSVAAGDIHRCAITREGALWCWGTWWQKEPFQVFGGEDGGARTLDPVQLGDGETWRMVSASQSTCAVRDDGTLWCWGPNAQGELGEVGTRLEAPVRLGDSSCWASVDVQWGHTCGVKRNGTLWCWGRNEHGQLGTGDTRPEKEPTQVGNDTDWTRVTTGSAYLEAWTCALKADGSVWCWGGGNGPLPRKQSGLATVSMMTAGAGHRCFLSADGTLRCGGNNDHGQLGQGTSGNLYLPVAEVAGGGAWRSVDAGGSHTCAIHDDDGTLWCWGRRKLGVLGDGEVYPVSREPTAVAEERHFSSLTAGLKQSSALDSTGHAWSWGSGETGWVSGHRRVPARIFEDHQWTQLSSGGGQSCGLELDGSLWCWGTNWTGELGVATEGNYSWVPVQVESDQPWLQVDAAAQCGGTNHACGIKTDGTLWCWGSNSHGQLGVGGDVEQQVPVQVGSDEDWRVVDGGPCRTCAIKENGALFCWGKVLNNVDHRVPLRVGTSLAWKSISVQQDVCGVQEDGSAWCWDPYEGAAAEPDVQRVAGDSDWRSVVAGSGQVCGIRVGGSLWCWGSNHGGGVGIPGAGSLMEPARVGADSDWESLAAYGHTCALKRDGSAWCWGQNDEGQVGDGTSWQVVPALSPAN